MIPLFETAKNYGDFTQAILPAYEGAAHSAAESGHANPWRRMYGSDVNPIVKQRYQRRLHEASKMIVRAFTGSKRDLFNLQEAMSISDFPKLFGDVIDRAVLANYMETPYTWNLIANEAQVNDFRPIKRFRIDGGTGLLGTIQVAGQPNAGQLMPITQGSQYPEDSLTDAQYTYQLLKYGKRMPFFWETFVNDDLNALKDTPARFGRGARRSEEYFVTNLFANNVSVNGPNGFPFYSNGNKNIVNNTNVGDTGGNNPVLTITALQRAMIVMMKQLDTTGQPISVEAMTLVVPPSLKVVAMNILNTDYVWMGDQGGTNGGANTFPLQQLHAMNWAKNIVRLAVNYYLPIVDTSHGNTGWYLFANPESGRPALEFGRLRGHIGPELFMKLPNSVAIGEGDMGPGPGSLPGTTNQNPMDGDFDTDAVFYKVREVFGGTQIDPIMSVYSNGSGS